jgi:Carboxypeptidase regulatory-like domain
MFTAILLPLVTAAQLQQPAPPRDTAPSRRGSASIAGRVTEQGSGRPLARAIVTLTPNGGDSIRTETLTDADGRYEFNGIEPGEYGVTAGPGELRATHLRQAFGKSSPMTLFSSPSRSGVDVKDGEVRSGVDIALRRALAIEGRGLDPWDQPMSNVQVHVVVWTASLARGTALIRTIAASFVCTGSHRADIASVRRRRVSANRAGATRLASFGHVIPHRCPTQTPPTSF